MPGRHLITSALPYINGVKHLGNLIGSMLPADAYARYLRLRGEQVLYICATDEHGTPAELAAREAGLDTSEYCFRQHQIQRRLGEGFRLSWDYFGRSSSPQNRELTQHFARRLEENGYIEEREDQQIYSPTDGRFLPDRYVIGTCPNCGYEAARGDQCENCTRLLEPTDLINPRSAISGATDLETRTTKHLYLLQSRLVPALRTFIDERAATWPPLVTGIARSWLDEGLYDRSITRDLSWGVPVDRPGFENKVFYVWFDAPIEYIGATAEWGAQAGEPDWKSWWYDADDVTYTQFMAKDNVPFHAIGFPATILGSKEPWKLVDRIKGFNWLTYYGGKFSTSQNRGVFMDSALELLPADYWRWHLLANAPESDDADFTWEHFSATVNKDLADIYGNLVNRLVAFAVSKLGDRISDAKPPGPLEAQLADEATANMRRITSEFDRLRFRPAAAELRALWAAGNAYIERAAPWAVVDDDPARAATIVRAGLGMIKIGTIASLPFIPDAAGRVLDALNVAPEDRAWPDADALGRAMSLPADLTLTRLSPLFQKLDSEDTERWKREFCGETTEPATTPNS
jgi:methionyl-tRNA synthetase